jgi:hypothetical protein
MLMPWRRMAGTGKGLMSCSPLLPLLFSGEQR